MRSNFGRTNRQVPPIWLSLNPPDHPFGEWRDELVAACVGAETVLDVTHSTGLWGDLLPREGVDLMVCLGSNTIHSVSASHAADLIQAELVQALSCLGGRRIAYVFWNVVGPHEEFQVEGVLAGFEEAIQDGIFQHLGLNVAGPAVAALALWQFHDAFDAVLIPRNPLDDAAYELLAPVAAQRNVGLVGRDAVHWRAGVSFAEMPSVRALPNVGELEGEVLGHYASNHPVIVPVSTIADCHRFAALKRVPIPDFESVMGPFVDAYRRTGNWEALAEALDPVVASRAKNGLSQADWLDPAFA